MDGVGASGLGTLQREFWAQIESGVPVFVDFDFHVPRSPSFAPLFEGGAGGEVVYIPHKWGVAPNGARRGFLC